MRGLQAFIVSSAVAVVMLCMGGCPQPTLVPPTAVLGEQEVSPDYDSNGDANPGGGTTVVPVPDESLSIGDITFAGSPVQGEPSMIALSCTAIDHNATVQSVTADLSQIGGSKAQILQPYGTLWTFSGTVIPPMDGTKAIVLTAIDDRSAVTTRTTSIAIATGVTSGTVPPPPPSAATNMIVTGRIVQGQACNIRVSYKTSSSVGSVQSVTADLSQIGGDASQTLTKKGNEWTWSGNVTASSSGTKTIALAAMDSAGAIATASTPVGVVDPQVLYADWLFLMPSQPVPDIPTVVEGVKKTGIQVVLLASNLWDWDRAWDKAILNEQQANALISELRKAGITVGFHLRAPYPDTIKNDQIWLDSVIRRLKALNAMLIYADGSYNVPNNNPWLPYNDNVSIVGGATYNYRLRTEVLGPSGILLGAWWCGGYDDTGDWRYLAPEQFRSWWFGSCDARGTHDQGFPTARTYCYAHPRDYVDWRIAELQKEQLSEPKWLRFDVGWIGEYIGDWSWKTRVTPWPLEDYRYVWKRAREAGFPITYRTTMEFLARPDDSRLRLIGEMKQTSSTTAHARWSCVATSPDGTKLVAAAYGGRLYTSGNSGATWIERQPAGNVNQNWTCVAISPDGSKILVGGWPSHLYVSTDFGATWGSRALQDPDKPNEAMKYWQRLVIASNGSSTRMVARVSGRRLYTSTDNGATWTLSHTLGTDDAHAVKDWSDVAVSADGKKMIMTETRSVDKNGNPCVSGHFYTSADSGKHWSLCQSLVDYNGTGKSCLAMSSDGTRMVVGAWGEGLFVSTDSGAHWKDPRPGDSPGQHTNRYWQCLAVSANGTKMIAGPWPGRLYVSLDSGVTWRDCQPAGDTDMYWESVAMSSDGTKIIATDGSKIYVSGDSGTTWIECRPAEQFYNL